MSGPKKEPPWAAHHPEGVRWDFEAERGTVPALFEAAAARFADRAAISWRGPDITYGELARHARRFAHALLRDGFGPGRTLAVYLPNCPFHPFVFFGALMTGGRIAHLSPLDAPRELVHKATDSEAETLVTLDVGPMLAAALKLLDAGAVKRVIVCEDARFGPSPIPPAPIPDRPDVIAFSDFVAGAPDGPVPARVSPDDVALLQYTGGTTGLPKGAMLTHGNLTSAVSILRHWFHDFHDPERPEVVLCVLPLFHIFALTTVLLLQLSQGARLLLRMRFDAEKTIEDIERERVTIFAGVPTMWIAVTNFPGVEGRDLSSLRNCSSGGAPLPVEVGRRFRELTSLELRGGWGMTETSPAGTTIPEGTTGDHPGTIGVPLPGLEMKIVDKDDPARDLAPGETGEIAIRGPNVFSGYWKRPEATRDAFFGDWFLTGDIGRMDADGFFHLVDRKSDLILSGGFNVYPQVVEQAIHEHPAVAEVSVIGVPDEYRGESAKAFVSLRAGAGEFTLEELQAFLAERVGRHEMPRALEFRESLPRTPVGKLSRKALREQEAARRAARGEETR